MTAAGPRPVPVLVGAGAVQQRHDDPRDSLEAVDLMAAAIREAAQDAGAPQLTDRVDAVLIPRGLWSCSDPGALLAERCIPGARSVLADWGILQQTLLTRACSAIARGDVEIVLVCGGEARYRARRAQVTGIDAPETAQVTGSPAELLEPAAQLRSAVEIERGLAAPARQYAVMESALRAARGLTVDEHRTQLAELWAGFSRVAAANPDAWNRAAVRPELLATASAANPMLATPYTKLHCSQWNVDQAAALLLTSTEVASRLGIAPDRLVFPTAAVESNAMIDLSSRDDLARCPAVAAVGEQMAELSGLDLAGAEHLDLYSCFPSAVQIQAAELGIATGRALTVTGGMTFAGGPLNNYSLQALVTLVRTLRADPGSVGLLSSVSGILTKQALSAWTSASPERPFASAEVGEVALARTAVLEVVAGCKGIATVVGFTVAHDHGLPVQGIVLADTDDGRRAVAATADPDLVASMAREEWVGREVRVEGPCFSC